VIPASLFRKIRRIEIRTRGLVRDVFAGEYHSAFRGRGMEFSEVRPYQMGDEVRSIDWNVSARMGETFVKVFEEEREQTVILAVDVSGSGSFGSAGVLKRELAAEVCALLAFSAVRNNDRVGLLLFTDVVERFVPPRKGKRHALRIIRDVFAHEAASSGTRLASALEHVVRLLRRRAILVVISDFLDDGYEKSLRAAASRHDVVAVHVVDPRERELPAVGLLTLRDAETGRAVLVDTASRAVREAFAAGARQRGAETAARLLAAGVDAVTVRTDEDYVNPLADFFRRRARRRRPARPAAP
jgi:uncharacterized protein (DUF58 family)